MGKSINKKTVIYNARLANEGKVDAGYLVIEGEYISEVGYGNVPEALLGGDNCTVDADGRLLMPGVIDEHVHFREPGFTQKADIMTESRAAVAGGVTSFIDMPNTAPATTTIEAVEGKMARAAEVSCANYGFFL